MVINFNFVLINDQISNDGGASSSSVWGDYNNDGLLDILAVAINNGDNYSGIYENNKGKFNFSQLDKTIGLPGENYEIGGKEQGGKR